MKTKNFEVQDTETGNWKLECFLHLKSAVHYAEEECKDSMPLSVIDLKTNKTIYTTKHGYLC